MARPMPPALPRQIISLVSILLVVFLVAFPSSSSIVATLVLLGGGAFLLQSRTSQDGRDMHQQPLEDAKRMAAALKGLSSNEPITKSGLQTGNEERPSLDNNSNGSIYQNGGAAHSAELQKQAESKPAQSVDGSAKATPKASTEAARDTQPTAAEPKSASGDRTESLERPKAATKSEKGNAASSSTATGSPAPLAGGAAVLARLRQQRANAQRQEKRAGREVIVAYASQTGTAQEIAKGVQAESAAHGIKSKVSSLNEVGFEALAEKKDAVLVIVASSTGDGDPPDNAAKFYATMRKRSQPTDVLSGVKFTCLGLGDSNYTRFMGVSRAIRTRLQELAAVPFYKMGEADEVDGLESVVDAWIAGLWPALKAAANEEKALASSPSTASADGKDTDMVPPKAATAGLEGVPALSACQIAVRWIDDATESSRDVDGSNHAAAADQAKDETDQPVSLPIQSAAYLTSPSAEKKVLHLEVGLEQSSLQYQPGDSISLLPVNEARLVDALQDRLGLRGTAQFTITSVDGKAEASGMGHICRPCTVKHALEACDITSPPRKSLLRTLAEHCSNEKEKLELLRLCSRGGRQDYSALISPVSPTLLDLLLRYPSCQPSWADLLYALQPLAPRLYSISSSPLEHPSSLHIALTVVKIGNPEPNLSGLQNGHTASDGSVNGHQDALSKGLVPRWGVGSGWLERRAEPLLRQRTGASVKLSVRLRKGGAFSHPSDLSAPVLMIGPGTGVAPFRGFLQHRRQLCKDPKGKVGPATLYFGCRSRKEDFLYGEELEGFVQDGTLTQLELAFSRETQQKVYVQHLMRKQGKTLASLLTDPKAYVFICGDGAHMAKDVNATLLSILEEHSGMSNQEAVGHLAGMTKAGQYVRDIWSS